MLNLNKANNSIGFHVIASCLYLIFLSGCSRDIHDHPGLFTGEQLFDYHCSECHRNNGNGEFLKGVPAIKNTRLSVGQIAHALRGEGEGEGEGEGVSVSVGESKRPRFYKMSEDEADKISLYLKGMNPNNSQDIVILEEQES